MFSYVLLSIFVHLIEHMDFGMKKKRILIVDDERSIVNSLKELLELEGYEVDGAGDGVECIYKVKRQAYDTIVMGYKMPKLNGARTLERLNIFAPLIPVIMTSSILSSEEGEEFVDMGALSHVQKPFDMATLLDEIENALEEYERRLGLLGDNEKM